MTHVAWSCDGKKLAAVGIDKVTRVWSPEKSVRHDFDSRYLISLVLYRWNLELRRCSLGATQTMSIMYHGIRHTQIYSVHPAKRTGESYSGMQGVRNDVVYSMYRVTDLTLQKVDISSNVH